MGRFKRMVDHIGSVPTVPWTQSGVSRHVSMETLMSDIDIVGNGPSCDLWQASYRYTVACNIPPKHVRYNCLSIIDNQPVLWMKNNSWAPRVPVYCTQLVKDTARSKNISGDWFPVYEKQTRTNSGQHAAEYFATKNTNCIHLWGMDSLWSEDLTSVQDKIIIRHRRPPLNRWWRPKWNEIFSNTEIEYVIHAPKGAQNPYEQENVRFEYHDAKNMAMDKH